MTTPAERFAALTRKEQERLRLLNEKLWAAEKCPGHGQLP